MASKKPVSIFDWEGFGGRKSIAKLAEQLRVVYVAGPMRGIPDFNFPEFDRGRDYIDSLNVRTIEAETDPKNFRPYAVVSPADMDRFHGFSETETNEVTQDFYKDCMRRDLEVVSRAYAILLLKDWEKSTGANNELFVARCCGVSVWVAEYNAEGEITGHTIAPEWLRSPLVYGNNGDPNRPVVDTNLHDHDPQILIGSDDNNDWGFGAERLREQRAGLNRRDLSGEVDQTIQLPPVNPNENSKGPEPTVLEEANGLIYGPRNADYGHPIDDFSRTGRMWGAILGELKEGDDIPPEKVGLMMVAVKISRECNKHKRDNLTDICGYAGTVDMVITERERRQEVERQEFIDWLADVGKGDRPDDELERTLKQAEEILFRPPAEVFAGVETKSGGRVGEWPVLCGCGSKFFDDLHQCADCGSPLADALVDLSGTIDA